MTDKVKSRISLLIIVLIFISLPLIIPNLKIKDYLDNSNRYSYFKKASSLHKVLTQRDLNKRKPQFDSNNIKLKRVTPYF